MCMCSYVSWHGVEYVVVYERSYLDITFHRLFYSVEGTVPWPSTGSWRDSWVKSTVCHATENAETKNQVFNPVP